MPKFSVVMPLYNKAPYVSKAIQSVLDQSFAGYELIVVDDGSSDNSAEIAMQVMEGHENCRLIRQENAGVSMARNNGVAASSGDYLCFLDADDWWDSHFLETMSQLVEDYPDAGAYGTNYTIVNATRHKTRVAPIGVEDGFEKGCINYCKVYAKTMAMPLWTGAVCIPRPVFDEMGGFPPSVKLGEDFLLWIHIALKYQVAFLNKPLAFYNQDVDVTNRSTNHLYEPQYNMLWQLADLEAFEDSNDDYKQLIDCLRVAGLLEYYASPEYHEQAKQELEKVDWTRQSPRFRRLYRRPAALLRVELKLLEWGSIIKKFIRRKSE